jgi:hypothetical protein
MKEIETKIIDFDEKRLRASLKKAKARYVGKLSFRRYVYDLKPYLHKGEADEFFRLRTDGKRSTLTYKLRKGKGLLNTEEIEVDVADFDTARMIISKMWTGRKPYYQENTIDRWMYEGAEIEIVRWPLIPPLVEVEAKSEKAVRSAIKKLKIAGTDMGNSSLAKIFVRYGLPGRDAADLRFKN